ncbi:MAG: SDR family oxidoreductase [Acidobacteriota bacterium]
MVALPTPSASHAARTDRIALVTGATGGIGGAVCARLAAAGLRVVVHHRAGDDPDARRRALDAQLAALPGGPHAAVEADLADADAVATLVARAADAADGDGIDVLVNNAGVFQPHPLAGPEDARVDFAAWRGTWQRTLQINLIAAADLAWHAAASMRRRGGGVIVNISSRGAFRGEPDAPAYGASKAGLNALSQSLAIALAADGIAVHAIAPGFVETAMARPHLQDPATAAAIRAQSPLGRVATVDDVAYWVDCLVRPDAAFATGAIVDVNGASYLRS